ncbi:MAG TPA: hypothetical protein PL124_11495, partial [Candidatus Cloacimonadota bacterium]|nr:hypothetical protein [Candidatus Cloacimonadota bacterium]
MDDQKQGTGSRRVRSVLLILVMLTLGVSLHAAISMRAIYPSEFYDRMMIGNGLMVTIEEATEYYSYLKVYDPSEPSDPQLLSSLYIYYREPRKPKLYRQHVYVPDQYGNRMRRYSLLNPAAPVLNYEYAFNMVGFRDMAFSGNYMLMSTQSLGLRIVNINSEGSASEVGHFTDNNPMFRVWASGDRAAVLSYDLNSEVGVLKLLDISNPASPYFSAVLEIPEYDYNDNIELVFHDHYLNVICDYTPTKVYDVSNMNAPVYLGEMEYGLTQTVYTNDYRICATGGAIHVQTLDDPLEPVDVASFDIQHNSYQHLQLDWPQLYLIGSEYSTNAYCLDLSDLNPPESLLFSYDTGNSVTSLTGWGQWLYSRDLIAELSPEGDIVEAISCPELSNVSRVRADEGLLQGIRTQVSECSLWNIGDTGELQLLSTIAGSANESIISGAYLFLRNSYGYSSYRCYDISDPSNPEFLFSLPEEYYSLAVSGNTFWVSSYLAIDAYSLDDPYLPVLIGSIPMGDAPHSFLPRLSYLNDHLYLSGYTNEIRVYDVSNPAAPAYVGHALLPLHYDAAEQAPRFS